MISVNNQILPPPVQTIRFEKPNDQKIHSNIYICTDIGYWSNKAIRFDILRDVVRYNRRLSFLLVLVYIPSYDCDRTIVLSRVYYLSLSFRIRCWHRCCCFNHSFHSGRNKKEERERIIWNKSIRIRIRIKRKLLLRSMNVFILPSFMVREPSSTPAFLLPAFRCSILWLWRHDDDKWRRKGKRRILLLTVLGFFPIDFNNSNMFLG